MKSGVLVAVVVALALVLGGCEFVQTRNRLATEKESINAEWSQVDTALQRRADLIPNLVETVKGYAKEETTIMTSVANARSQLLNAQSPQQKIDANNNLSSALGRLKVRKIAFSRREGDITNPCRSTTRICRCSRRT
jgi:LemA protein